VQPLAPTSTQTLRN